MGKELGIRILHYKKPGGPDRTAWTGVMQHILDDPRVSVYQDHSGTPYSGLNNVYHDLAKQRPKQVLMMHHDVLPCFNFIPTVERITDLVGDEPVSFYTNSSAVDVALKRMSRWVKLKPWFFSQAYTMPFDLMTDMISWINENVGQDDRMSDDERMGMYFYYHNRHMLATAPSLVEHIGWNTTTVDYTRPIANYLDDKSHRMAKKFIGIDMDPRDIDWTKGLQDPVVDETNWALEDVDILFQRLLKPSSKFKK